MVGAPRELRLHAGALASARCARRRVQECLDDGRVECTLGRGRTARTEPFGKDARRMDRDYELQTHRAEDRHWWYRGRREVLERVIAELPLPAQARILDAGCGSGRNMVELARRGTVTGVELSATSASLARGRETGRVIEGSVAEMPFEPGSFDLAVCLDVIEHLEDDLGALRELRRVVTPGGSLLVTVPAYQWLWSRHDVINHHRRRYTRGSLLAVAERAGWECIRTTYFNSLLLPVAILLRALDRLSPRTTESSLDLWIPPQPLNRLLEQPLRFEAGLLGRGGRIPVGLSLLAVFR
jgi:SAM-dependent methyltransferase